FEWRSTATTPQSRDVVPSGTDKRLFPEFYEEYGQTQGFVGMAGDWVCIGPVRYTGHKPLQRDIENLKAAMVGVGALDAFLPVVAPASVAPSREDEFYSSEEEYVFAIAEALAEEYRAIVDAGLMVQIDDAHLTVMYDRMGPERRDEFRAWAELRTEALVHALRGIPPERTRYHVCWGSWNAPHVGDVPITEIIDLILRVPVGGYAIEQANPRHEHEWRVWEEVTLPEGRSLIPGVISMSRMSSSTRNWSPSGSPDWRRSSGQRTSSRVPTVGSLKVHSSAVCILRSCGQSSALSLRAPSWRRGVSSDRDLRVLG